MGGWTEYGNSVPVSAWALDAPRVMQPSSRWRRFANWLFRRKPEMTTLRKMHAEMNGIVLARTLSRL